MTTYLSTILTLDAALRGVIFGRKTIIDAKKNEHTLVGNYP